MRFNSGDLFAEAQLESNILRCLFYPQLHVYDFNEIPVGMHQFSFLEQSTIGLISKGKTFVRSIASTMLVTLICWKVFEKIVWNYELAISQYITSIIRVEKLQLPFNRAVFKSVTRQYLRND